MYTHVDVLLVEDNPGDADLVKHHLDKPSVQAFLDEVSLTHVESLTDCIETLEATQYDVVLLDLGLPESDGIDTLHRLAESASDVPIIVLTGIDKTTVAVEAIQSGAQDYLPKDDLDGDRLVRSLMYALERHKQERMLTRRNEQLDFFNSLLRHDMMNGLNVMMARAELLEADLTDPDHVEDAANITKWGRNIVDLAEKIRSILDTVMAEDGDSLERISLRPVVVSEVERVRTMTDRVTFTADVDADTSVLANELLSDVIGNLLTNVVEHTEGETSVTIDTEETGHRIHLRVSDDGAGIGPEDRDEIFERGGKGAASTGTGFGLYFVSSMVDSYGGNVTLESNDAGGATFCLDFRRP